MHVTTKQLLSLLDREPVVIDVRQHVDSCDDCQRELRDLRTVRQSLQQLSSAAAKNEPSFADGWNHLADRIQLNFKLKQSQYRQRRRIVQLAVAASFALIAVLLVPSVLKHSFFNDSVLNRSDFEKKSELKPKTPLNPQNLAIVDSSDRELEQFLTQRNMQLEQALRKLPQTPAIVHGETAYTIAALEDQIALVDYGLSYSEQMGIGETGSISLLRNRADLLDSLYKVRYTQAMVSLAY